MNIQEARIFIARFVQGKHSQKEHENFLEWVHETSIEHIQVITDEYESLYKQWPLTGRPSVQWVTQLEDRLDRLDTGVMAIPIESGRGRRIGVKIGWAAAILVLLSAGSYFLFFNKDNKASQPTENIVKVSKKAIEPGIDKAVLKLADGSNILLNTIENGVVTQQGNTIVKKSENGHLVYQPIPNGQQPALLYNTVFTPRGGQYQLTLPDQTKIWLNAESSIRFPVAFTGKERRVEITGEVYFEVTENHSMPFKAVIGADLTSGSSGKGRGEVEVVGTHFNIKAYNDENAIQTTLLKGSVKVAKGTVLRLLKPGQQASMPNDASAGENIKVVNLPEPDLQVSWKDGYFSGKDFHSILEQAARWYDVQIVYEGKVPDGEIGGSLSRNMKIDNFLTILRANGIKTELLENERKIIVK